MWHILMKSKERRLRDAGEGRHAAGRGLWLCRCKDGAATWVLCIAHAGETRDIEIGTSPEMSLGAARKEAAQWRGLMRRGLDPAAQQETFRNDAARNLHQFYC